MQLQKGSVVALVTPMTSDYKVDTTSLRKLLQYHIQSHTDGLCILGTTGEATTLTMAEREQVLEITVDECKHKMPILVGTGAIDPQHIKEHTSQAIHMGCDASLVVTPYYVKPPQRGLVRHYHAVADMGLPVIMYNVPGRTGVDMSPATIGLCAEHPNIIGVKEATGDVPRLAQIISEVRKHRRSSSDDDYQDFLSYSGDDGTCADFVLSGGHGCISVTANILPQQMHNVMSSALLGDAAKCHELNDSLDILHQRLFVETNPIPTKYALCKMGMITSDTMRPPLTTLDPIHFASLEEALKLAGAV